MPAALMIALAVFGELISSYIGILGIAAFVLNAAFILLVGAHSARKPDGGVLSAGAIGMVLGLVCAVAGSAARYTIISFIPTDYAPSTADAAGMMVVGAVQGSVFWMATGFALGAIGAVFAGRREAGTG